MPESLSASTTLPTPSLRLSKPANVTRIASPPLPPLPLLGVSDPSPTAASIPTGSPVLEPAEPAPRRRQADTTDPYEPLGVRAGAFLLKPSIEVDFGYDSNPAQQPGRVKGATLTTIVPRVDFSSDWSRHEIRGTIDGGFTHYFGIDDPNRPTLNAVVDGRLDVSRDTAIESEGRLYLDTERIGSDGVPLTASKRPLTTQAGTTLGVLQRFGPGSVELKGAVDRYDYEEVTPGEQRSYTAYGLALRGGYEVSPAVRPFVEVGTDWRRYDERPSSGPDRNSVGTGAKAGVALALTGKLTGEASLGYGHRDYVGPSLPPVDGLLANASLVWTATPLTTVTLTASTGFDESTVTGSSGYVSRTAGIEVDHALRRNWIVSASASLTRNDYDGISRIEDTVDAGLGVEYRLSRSVAVKGRYAYEHLASTVPGSDYTENAIMVGLKMQP
jgi:hypothetical protein